MFGIDQVPLRAAWISRAALFVIEEPLNAGDVETPKFEAVLTLPILSAAAATTLTVVAPGATTGNLFVDSNLRAIQLYGTILNSTTAGDLQFQWAQNTSSANGTSVKAGSSIFGRTHGGSGWSRTNEPRLIKTVL